MNKPVDPSVDGFIRYRIDLAYDGTNYWGFAAQNGLHLAFLLAFQMHLQQRCVAGQAGSFANIARDSLGVGISKFLPVHNPRPPHD